MGVVGSLPLPSPLPNNSDIQNENSLPSSDESSHKTMSVISDDINNNYTKSRHHQRLYKTITRDHLCTKTYLLIILRVEPVRYSEYGRHTRDGLMKHKLRYTRNRGATRVLKTKYNYIIEQLKREILELDIQRNILLLQIEKLHLYKQQLVVKYHQISSNHQFIE